MPRFLSWIDEVGSFNPSKYFEEKYFWEKANVGSQEMSKIT